LDFESKWAKGSLRGIIRRKLYPPASLLSPSRERERERESMVKFSCKVGERSYAVELEGSQTVLEGKQLLTTAAPESNGVLQRWIFRGRILTDASLLSETGIGEGEVVIVIPGKNAAAAPSAMTQGAPSSSSLPAQSSTLQGNLYAADPMVTNNSRILTMQMDSAMSMLLISPTEVVEAAVSTMLKITTNIITSPLEEKYRRIPQTNANFNAKLGSVAGGRQLMQAVGFEATGDAWVLVPSADKWPVLVACHQKLLAFSERLKRSMSSPDAPTQAPQAAAAPAPAATTPTPPTPPPADAPAAIPQDQLLALVASLSLAASSDSSSSSSSGGGDGSGGGSNSGGSNSGGSSSGDGSGGSAPDGASQG